MITLSLLMKKYNRLEEIFSGVLSNAEFRAFSIQQEAHFSWLPALNVMSYSISRRYLNLCIRIFLVIIVVC